MIRRPPRSTLFPTRRSSDLDAPDRCGTAGQHDLAERREILLLGVDHDQRGVRLGNRDRKSTRLNSSHGYISYAVFCLKKKNTTQNDQDPATTNTSSLTTTHL